MFSQNMELDRQDCNQVTKMMGLCLQIRVNPCEIYQHGEFPQICLETAPAFHCLLTWQLSAFTMAVKIGWISGLGPAVSFTQEQIIHHSMHMFSFQTFAVQEYYEWRRKYLFLFEPIFPQENIWYLCGVYTQTTYLVLMLSSFQKCQVIIRLLFFILH